MGRRKKNAVAKDLIALPWQVSAIIAVTGFVGIRWILPALLSTSPLMAALETTFDPVSWIALCAFGFVALASAIRAKLQGRNPAMAKAPAGKRQQPAPECATADVAEQTRAVTQAVAAESSKPELQPAPGSWSLDALRQLEWKRFELLCARYYEAMGFRSETLAAGPDGGIDVKLFKIDPSRPLAVVQCKAWNTQQVGVKEIRELLGVMVHEKVARGIFITTGTYTQDAITFGGASPIQLLNGASLTQKILDLPPEKQQVLLAFAFDGDYRTPSCASCGIKMVKRDSKRGPFWGCAHYPRCKTVMQMRTPSPAT